MCVNSLSCQDYAASKSEDALAAMTPGTAVSFNRVAFHHFAIFLGWAWPKGGDADPIPLLCHLSGSPNSTPKASVRLDDFRDIVEKSKIRVYTCTCSCAQRSEVINQCLFRVGKTGYNLLTRNCEHFVREVIDGQRISYQVIFTILVPLIQVPRIGIGSAIGGVFKSSLQADSPGSVFDEHKCLGLINPEMDLIELLVDNRGLDLKAVRRNATCTREFAGPSGRFPLQMLHACRSCGTSDKQMVCKSCRNQCHADCFAASTGKVCEDQCSCLHTNFKGETLVKLRPRGGNRDPAKRQGGEFCLQ